MPPKKSKASDAGKAEPKQQKTVSRPKKEEPKKEEPKKEEPKQEEKPVEKTEEKKSNGAAADEKPAQDETDKMEVDSITSDSKKRKTPPTSNSKDNKQKPPAKVAREGSRASSRNISSTQPTTRQLINFLLSADSLPYCYPDDELNASKNNKDLKKTYSMTPPSSFTPFEQLLIAHLLSKPLSHTLGMRSIRTLLNPPYSLISAKAIVDAGEKRVWEALETAKTQHRQKTATYIYQMAQTYHDPSKEEGEAMYNLSTEANDDGPQGVIKHIKETVAGMGATGAELFCRRIQCVDGWGDAVWPHADPKSLDALRELGLKVHNADELQSLVEKEVDWEKVGNMGLAKLVGTGREDDESPDDMDFEQRVQVEFVVLLERAIGCVLEGKGGEVRKRAMQWK